MGRHRRYSSVFLLIPLALAGVASASLPVPVFSPACRATPTGSFTHADFLTHFRRTKAQRKAFMKTLPSKSERVKFQRGFNAWEKLHRAAGNYAEALGNGLNRLEQDDHRSAIPFFARAQSYHDKARGYADLGPDEASYYRAEATLRLFHANCEQNATKEAFFLMPQFGNVLEEAIKALSDGLERAPELWAAKFSLDSNAFLLTELTPLVQDWRTNNLDSPLREAVTFEKLQGLFEAQGMLDVALGCCSRRRHTPSGRLDAFRLQLEMRRSQDGPCSDEGSWWSLQANALQSVVEDAGAPPEVRGRAALFVGEMKLAPLLTISREQRLQWNREQQADVAERMFRQAIEYLGGDLDAWRGLAATLLFRGGEENAREAARLLEQAIAADPTDLSTRLHLAVACADLSDAEALSTVVGKAVTAIGRSRQEVWRYCSGLFGRLGRDEAAIEALREAARVSGDPELWCTVGVLCREHGSYEAAEAALRKSIAQDASNADTWALLAENHVDQKQMAEAEGSFLEALQRGSENSAIWRSLRLHLQVWSRENDGCGPALPRLKAHVAALGSTPAALSELAFLNGSLGWIDSCAALYAEAYCLPGGERIARESMRELFHVMSAGHDVLLGRIRAELPDRPGLEDLNSGQSRAAQQHLIAEAREEIAQCAYGDRICTTKGINRLLLESHRRMAAGRDDLQTRATPAVGALGIIYASPLGN